MTIILDDNISKDLARYCMITGSDPQEVVAGMVDQGLSRYRGKNGRIEAKEAVFTGKDGRQPYSDKPCYILGEKMIFGKPYYRVLTEGRLLNVQREMVMQFPGD